MSGRWRILLIASLVANVFLIGAAVGFLASGAAFRGGPGHRRPPNLWSASENLSQPDRLRFRQALHKAASDARPLIQQARQARRQAADLMSAPTYDAKAVADAMAQARQAEGAARARIDAALVAYLASAPAADRAALAQGMMRGGPHGRRFGAPFARDGAPSPGSSPGPPPGFGPR